MATSFWGEASLAFNNSYLGDDAEFHSVITLSGATPALSINPPTGLNQGLVITQTVSGTLALSAYDVNEINVTDEIVDNSALSNGGGGYALRSILNVGTGATGSKNALAGIVSLNTASVTTSGDMIAIQGNATATQPNGGHAASTYIGTLFGGSLVAIASSGATFYADVIGAELQGFIASGGSGSTRLALAVAGNGTQTGAFVDAGIGFYTYTAAGAYAQAMELINTGGFAPIATGGTIIGTDGSSDTVANFADLHTYTFTGNIFNFPNYVLDHTGQTTIAGVSVVSCSGVTAGTVVVTKGYITHC